MQPAEPVLLLDHGGVQVLGPQGHKLALCDGVFECSQCGYECPKGKVAKQAEHSIAALEVLLTAL